MRPKPTGTLPSLTETPDAGKHPGGLVLPEFHGIDWNAVAPKRVIAAKELAEVFGLTTRHLRRLHNELGLLTPTRRRGSVRITAFAPEEIARFAAHRFRAGRSYNFDAATRLGCVSLLEAIKGAVAKHQIQSDPKHFRDLRLEVLIDVAACGAASTLAYDLGYTAAEIPGLKQAAAYTFRQLLGGLPGFRQQAAQFLQAALLALAVRNGTAWTSQIPQLLPLPPPEIADAAAPKGILAKTG